MTVQSDLETRRSALSDEKRALLQARLAGRVRGAAETAAPSIARRPQEAERVLSFAQQRLWFLDQLVPGSPFYTESAALHVQAAISVPAFEQALNEIVRRHEVLRTIFSLTDDHPVAVVARQLHVPLPVIDLTALPETQRQAEIVRLAAEEARRPFDLERGPLLRTTLLRLGPAEWVFLLAMHHIVCDGWSSSVFSRELSALYCAFVAGQPSPLDELPIQYADFAHWQRGWLQGEVLDHQLRYWRRQLADLPQLELPADWPRPAVFSYLGAHHRFALNRALTDALVRFGQLEGATLFMTLLSGFNTLLHRYSSQDDLVIGVPVANRSRRELEPLIGFFVNVLVMRSDLSGQPTHRELLRRVRATALDAYANQDLPFEKLVEDLHPERDLARNPLFQVIFQLHENPNTGSQEMARGLPAIEVDRATVKFDLRVDFFQDAGGLQCVIEYSTDLFTADRIERLEQHLRTIYEQMVRAPEQRIGDFTLVTGDERATIERWGAVHQPPPLDATIDRAFAEQALRTPDAEAIVTGTRAVSYAELDERANAVAHELQTLGVKHGDLVAVSATPGLPAIIALLAIAKAGAAYLPVDPAYPDERLRFMLRDGNVRVLIGAGGGARFDAFGLTCVVVTGDEPLREAPPLPNRTAPDDLAYVMYTSGSTGAPKGVCITHRGVLRLVTGANFCSMTADETFLLLAPLTFDATTLEIWAPLLNGGKLAIYPEQRVSLDELERALIDGNVSTLWLTAGLFHEIVDARPEALSRVRQLLAGGDVLSPRHVRRQLERFPDCRVINGYGPTENTTFTCCHPMDRDTPLGTSVPIGSPITRTRVYVVDRYDQLAPIGIPGELCAGGAGLARCYWNDAALTAERFVPDPFSPGERMYRTGDRVRFRADGTVEFLGRIDRQIKIRGFRVEPGEIERALLKHPNVLNAALVVSGEQDKRLVAFIVPQPADSDAERTLTSHWQTLYDDLYLGLSDSAAPDFDTAGWNASGSGTPIPQHEMAEWLSATVARIREQPPRRVLEIGCGTGMLAFRLARDAESYTGTDFSAPVVDRLRERLARAGIGRARLLVRTADDPGGIEQHGFDTIILNSVIQYFPGIDYLLRVIETCIDAAAPAARIFIGDVRSLPHLEAFHTILQLSRAGDALPPAELQRRVARAMRLEQELVVDPGFFTALRVRFPRLAHVDVQWKRGLSENELTRYRYDVVLQLDDPRRDAESVFDLGENPSLDDIRATLIRRPAEVINLRMTNGRLAHGTDAPALDALWQIAEGTAYTAHIRPGNVPELCAVQYATDSSIALVPDVEPRRWHEYTNSPAASALAERLGPSLRRHLEAHLPEYMLPSSFVVVDALPLTRNGKIDRAALLALCTEQPAAATDYVAARSDVEQRLAQVWAEVLGVARVGVNDNFFELGGDSILCIRVISRAKSAALHFTVKQMFEHQTVAKLAAVASSAPAVHADQGPVTGTTPLTPAQAWMLSLDVPNVSHFNQSIFLEIPRALDASVLDRALRALIRHHDALRLRCEESRAFYAPPDDRAILECHNLSLVAAHRRREALESHCASVQAALDLVRGPVLRAVRYDLGSGNPARLLLAAHHFAVDGVTWRVLLEDLWSAYSRIAEGAEPALPAKTTSMQYWAQRLAALADSESMRDELPYWLQVTPRNLQALPVDHDGANTNASAQSVSIELTEAETEVILTQVPQWYRTQVNDVLLTALTLALARWTGDSVVCFDLEGHGREPLFDDVDLSRTAGWFTSIFPIRLEADPAVSPVTTLLAVKEQLAAIPRRGVGYGILRYLASDDCLRDQLAALPRRQLSFNYLGQFGGTAGSASTIRGAGESPGPMRDPRGTREYLIEVDGSVAHGRLSFSWTFSEGRHERATVESVAHDFAAALRSIAGSTREVSSEHFPDAGLAPDDFQRLLASLEQAEDDQP